MTTLRNYFISVIAVALIASIIKRLVGQKGTTAAIGRLMTGLVLTFTIISPLVSMSFSDMSSLFDAYAYDAQQAVQSGTKISSDLLHKSIKDKTEAYILDKARQYHADLTVDVVLTNDTIPKPSAITISGNVGPYAKKTLQNIICNDLGINKENQLWT